MSIAAETPIAPLDTLAAELERTLKLRTPPIGMKLFESPDAFTAIPNLSQGRQWK